MRYVAVVAVPVLLCILVGCSSKELPLPEHEQGIKTVSGPILRCDIDELGSSGRTIFVGMEIDAPTAPYIRFNFPRSERAQYETWCAEHTDVSIRYRAKRTELRPTISYWAENIEANET